MSNANFSCITSTLFDTNIVLSVKHSRFHGFHQPPAASYIVRAHFVDLGVRNAFTGFRSDSVSVSRLAGGGLVWFTYLLMAAPFRPCHSPVEAA